jgi:hypothetical protein
MFTKRHHLQQVPLFLREGLQGELIKFIKILFRAFVPLPAGLSTKGWQGRFVANKKVV